MGGKDIPGGRGEIGAYVAKVIPGGVAEQTGKVVEGKRRMKEIYIIFILYNFQLCDEIVWNRKKT